MPGRAGAPHLVKSLHIGSDTTHAELIVLPQVQELVHHRKRRSLGGRRDVDLSRIRQQLSRFSCQQIAPSLYSQCRELQRSQPSYPDTQADFRLKETESKRHRKYHGGSVPKVRTYQFADLTGTLTCIKKSGSTTPQVSASFRKSRLRICAFLGDRGSQV
jgi:hypothetical protein